MLIAQSGSDNKQPAYQQCGLKGIISLGFQ